MRNRVEVMHGVNLDQLGRRDPAHYGSLTLDRPRAARSRKPRDELGLEARFFQTNHEGEFVEHLHRLDGMADAIVLNPGRLDALLVRDPRRARVGRPTRGRGAPVRRRLARVVAASLGDHRVVHRARRRQGPRRVPRRARAGPRRARSDMSVGAADRLTERLPDAGIDALLVTDLDQRPLSDRVHGQQRDRADRGRRADVRHRLSLRRAGGGGGGRGVRPPSLAAASARGGGGRAPTGRAPARLRGRRTCRSASTRGFASCCPTRIELVAASGLVEELRAVKEPDEVAAIKAAAALADEAFAAARRRRSDRAHRARAGAQARVRDAPARRGAAELRSDRRRRPARRAAPRAAARRRRSRAASSW